MLNGSMHAERKGESGIGAVLAAIVIAVIGLVIIFGLGNDWPTSLLHSAQLLHVSALVSKFGVIFNLLVFLAPIAAAVFAASLFFGRR